MAISAEQLNVILSARDREFTRAMDRAQRRVQNFSQQSNRNLMSSRASFMALSTAARGFLPALSAGLVIQQVRRVVSELDEIGKKADAIGLTTDALQELRVVAEEAGVSQEALDNSMMQFSRRLGEARQGLGQARYALEELNISADTLAAMPLDQALQTVAEEMSKVGDATTRTALAQQLFGRSGVPMLNLLREGADGMERMRENARELGIVIDEDLIRNAEAAENQLGLMSRVIDANVSEALIRLAPLLVRGSELLANFANNVSYLMGLFDNNGPSLDEQIANLVGQQEILDERIAAARAATPDARTNPAIASLEEEWRRVTIQLSELIAQQNEAAASAAEIQVDEENVIVLEELTLETTRAGNAAADAAETYEEMLAKIIEANPALRDLGFTADTLGSTMKMVEGSMENAFMSMVDGTMTAKDAFRTMARDIIAQLYRVLVVQRMVGTFGAGGGGILGSIFGMLNPASATGQASGGMVQAGQPYTVGEHGRELFVPQSAGRVLSVSQTKDALNGGGGGVVVNQTINVSTGVQQTVRTEIKQLMPQIAESAKSAVVDAKRRGGSYGRAFS